MERHIYRTRNFSFDEFRAELDEIWAELNSDPGLDERLRGLGIEPTEVIGRKREDFIEVRRGASGLDWAGVAVDLLVSVAPIIFEHLILPRLKIGRNREAIELESREQLSTQTRSNEPSST